MSDNPTELRAAAERLRRMNNGESVVDVYCPEFELACHCQHSDEITIADAYLREHPADDDETALTTDELAREIESKMSSLGDVDGVSNRAVHFKLFTSIQLRTRRDVRDLLRMLKGSE